MVNLHWFFSSWPCLLDLAKRGIPNLATYNMQIARLYLRVSTAEQDLARQADIKHSARQAGYYIAGIYREKRPAHALTVPSCCA